MGANGDAENFKIGSDLDFLVGPTAHIDGFLQGTRIDLAPHSTNTARESFLGQDNVTLIRAYPARMGNVRPKRVDPAVPVMANVENLPFGRAITLDALGAAAPVVTNQIASGRTRSLR
jgi:hypothetical protein